MYLHVDDYKSQGKRYSVLSPDKKKKKKSKIKLDLSSEAERCTGMSVNHKMDLPISKRSGNNENPDRVLQFTHPTSLHCVWLELGLSH